MVSICSGPACACDAVASHSSAAAKQTAGLRRGEIIAACVTFPLNCGHLPLVGTPYRITYLFAIAGLDGVFERYATTEEASRGLQ